METPCAIGRATNGISINGYEFLLDGPGGDYMKFEDKAAAYAFIREEAKFDPTDEQIEDQFTFFDYEKLQEDILEEVA